MLPDPQLDAELRAIPLPEGLLDRLRAIALADDDGLDAALREVAVPRGLQKKLRHIPLADDQGLDEALRSVPVPRRLTTVWRRRAGKQDRWLRLGRIMAAASVLFVIALSYGMLALLSYIGGPPAPVIVKEPEKEPPLINSLASQPRLNDLDWAPTLPAPDVKVQIDLRHPRVPPGVPGFAMPTESDALAKTLLRDAIHGTYDTGERDKLYPVTPLKSRGLEWPLVTGSNQAFLIWNRTHPFVSPGANPRLQSCLPPLAADTASFELTRRFLEGEGKIKGKGELPPPREIWADDFLNALDYEYLRPDKRPLGLTIAAGPSPFRGEGYCLLQVGVQAREVPDDKRDPVHLVLAVDTSGSMQWAGRGELVRRALKDLVKRLNPGDRLSLIGFSERASVLVKDVGPAEVGDFMAAVDWLPTEGGTNVVEGLDEALSVAYEQAGAGKPPVRVVLLTDGWLEMDRTAADRMGQRVMEAAARGMPLSVIDLGQEGREGEVNPELAALARTGQGTAHRVVNLNQARWALREIVTGRPQLVARDAQLKVTFNPKNVLEYRLLGHEALELGGAASPATDFRSGQSATVLYELRMAPNGHGNVGNFELTWHKPDAQPRTAKDIQRLGHGIECKDFAALFSKAAPSLQEAALVAQFAEVLRKSPFVQHERGEPPLAKLWNTTGQVDSSLYRRASFVEFLTMVEQAMKAKPARARK